MARAVTDHLRCTSASEETPHMSAKQIIAALRRYELNQYRKGSVK